jgi:hypothetical protein
MAEQRRTPAITRRWELELRATGSSGDLRFYCPRCATPAVIELAATDAPLPGDPPSCISAACLACSVPVLIVLEGPPPTRPPHAYSRPPATRLNPATPPVADPPIAPEAAATERLTLSEWQQQGIGTELHPSTAAAIPRASDERPGRRSDDGRRLYTREEILAAVQRHSEQQRLHHQPPASPDLNRDQSQEGNDS